jgi:RNA polymerase sigma factor (sigma-70 family)
METGHKQYLACCYSALGDLARQGFAVQPADAEDLIQGFFADVWPGLRAHYDPARGPKARYVYGAFVQFARRQILRWRRWQPRQRDMDFLAEQLATPGVLSPLDALVRQEEVQACRQALVLLPPQRRAVLLDFFASGPRSRRKLAHKYGMKRDKFNALLLNAYGQLIVSLAEWGAWPLPDKDVAFALWCEGWDVQETADRLHRPVEEIRQTKEGLTKLLRRLLANSAAGRPPASAPIIVSESSLHRPQGT